MAYQLPSYHDEVQSKIGEELKKLYEVSQELPHRLLVVLMQLKEIDRNQDRPSRKKPGARPRPKRRGQAGR